MKYLVNLIILIRCLKIQGDLEWKVLEKVRDYGQNVTLFCNVSNCCPKLAGWDKYTPAQQTLFIDLKKGRPNKKYDGKVLKDGYTLVIQNLTKEDLNVSYACVYGSTIGDKQSLLEENVFNYISSTQQTGPIDNRNLSAGQIVGIVFGVLVVPVVSSVIFFWKRRREMHRNIGNRNADPFLEEPNDINCIENMYEKKPGQKGLVLIVNFPFRCQNNNRQGSEMDVHNLTHFFKEELNYQVECTTHDMTRLELHNYLKEIATTYLEENSKDYHSFICVLIGHAHRYGIFTADRYITIEEIKQIFKNHPGGQFNGKPKIFIIQACQTRMPNKPYDASEVKPFAENGRTKDDIIVAWSRSAGCMSARNIQEGASFIRAFLYVAKNKYKDEHIEKIFINVRRELDTNPKFIPPVGYLDEQYRKAAIDSTFTKTFFL